MGWHNEEYFYTIGTLKAIAYGYECLYSDAHLASLFLVAESKADFDISLNAIGRGEWRGLVSQDFRHYKDFGKEQQVVIANILWITDVWLEGLGFYQIPQLRGQAYSRMVAFLNERRF